MIGEILFGRYRVDAMESTHEWGETWRGADLHALAPVTIKLWRDDSSADRALLEGEAMAAVRHDSVVRLVDFGLHEGTKPCLVMEHVEGDTLADRLARVETLGWVELFELVAEALDGLGALHDEGLVHGDLCPENLVLLPERPGVLRGRRGGDVPDRPRIKVVGLDRVAFAATDSDPVSPVAPTGMVQYMAPEQLGGAGASAGSDVYAMGVVLWEALTGQSLFADDPRDITARHQFRPAFDTLPDLPIAAKLAIDRMLRSDLSQRETNARFAARRLRTAVGAVETARPTALGVVS